MEYEPEYDTFAFEDQCDDSLHALFLHPSLLFPVHLIRHLIVCHHLPLLTWNPFPTHSNMHS